MNVVYLTTDDLCRLTDLLGVGPIRDIGLLESAAARPKASAFGEDAYPSLDLKAAALMHSLAGNHALVDGNKRLAWIATHVFLLLNSADVDLDNDEVFDLAVGAAAGRLEFEDIAKQLKMRSI